jgi:FixJ family two-component response regulator
VNSSKSIVFVIDDDPSVRKALSRLLKYARFQVEVFASAADFLMRSRPEIPACIILDVQLPGLNGLDLQAKLEDQNVHLPIVFITGRGDIPMSVRAMKAGAVDFLTKPFDNKDLLTIVRKAVDQHAQTLKAEAAQEEIRRRYDVLSPREREVMAQVITGMVNKQTANKLGVTEKTVKAHRARVMQKMRARSVPDLVRMADHCPISQ